MLSFSKSASLYKQACRTLAGGVSSGIRKWCDPLLYFERADGPYYYDVDGNEFVDYTLAWGPLIAGSNHPRINAAVTAQLGRSYTLGAQHELEIELSSRLVEILPGVEQVIFSNTGSEAVQAALRLARATTGRDKFIKFEGHYHGWFNNILVSFHPAPEQLGVAVPTCGGQPASEYADTIALPWNDLEVVEKAFTENPGEIAAVITEPMLANSGSCMPAAGYLEGLIDLCREHGAVSIFDEVITGFRIALGGAREYFALNPDLSVYAKAMAGGFTMGAVGGRRELFEVLHDGRTIHAGTYNGTSFNLAAALATLELLSAPGTYERMHQHGQAIREQVEKTAKKRKIQLVTCGLGTVFNIHFDLAEAPLNYTGTLKANQEKYAAFHHHMLHRGVHLLPDGRWYVGLAHTDKELERTLKAVTESLEELA